MPPGARILCLAPLRGVWVAVWVCVVTGSLVAGLSSTAKTPDHVAVPTGAFVGLVAGVLVRWLAPRGVGRPALWAGGLTVSGVFVASWFIVLMRDPPLGMRVGLWGPLVAIVAGWSLLVVDALLDAALGRIERGEVPGVALRPKGDEVEVLEMGEVGSLGEPAARVLAVVALPVK